MTSSFGIITTRRDVHGKLPPIMHLNVEASIFARVMLVQLHFRGAVLEIALLCIDVMRFQFCLSLHSSLNLPLSAMGSNNDRDVKCDTNNQNIYFYKLEVLYKCNN